MVSGITYTKDIRKNLPGKVTRIVRDKISKHLSAYGHCFEAVLGHCFETVFSIFQHFESYILINSCVFFTRKTVQTISQNSLDNFTEH